MQKGHSVTVISSKAERQKDIEALGAKAAIGTVHDVDFLTATFKGADIVYLMGMFEAAGSLFDKEVDFIAAFTQIGNNYKQAIQQSGVKKGNLSQFGWGSFKRRERCSFYSLQCREYVETASQ
ncbi:MAG: NAD(P)H-binding protein [Bacteroidota bacterium]